MAELPAPESLRDVDGVARAAARDAARRRPARRAGDDSAVAVLSSGLATDSAWFEHRMLAEEMGVPARADRGPVVDDGHGVPAPRPRRAPRRRPLPADGRGHAAALPGATAGRCGPACSRRSQRGHARRSPTPWATAIGDDKAVYAYVPALIEYYLGEKPLLADVPTYLCGEPEQRGQVLARLEELVVKPVDGYGGDRNRHRPARDRRGARRAARADPAPPRTAGSPRRSSHLSTHPTFDGHRSPRATWICARSSFTGDERAGRSRPPRSPGWRQRAA